MGGDVPAQRKGRVEVDLDDLAEVGVGEGLGRVPPLDPRAVDEDAHLVPVGEDRGDERGDVAGGGQVGGVDGCFAA